MTDYFNIIHKSKSFYDSTVYNLRSWKKSLNSTRINHWTKSINHPDSWEALRVSCHGRWLSVSTIPTSRRTVPLSYDKFICYLLLFMFASLNFELFVVWLQTTVRD